MSIMTIAARLNRHPDLPSAAAAAQPVAETRSHGDAVRTSFVHHWPLLFIMAGAAAMIAWIGTIVWAAISLLLWMLG